MFNLFQESYPGNILSRPTSRRPTSRTAHSSNTTNGNPRLSRSTNSANKSSHFSRPGTSTSVTHKIGSASKNGRRSSHASELSIPAEDVSDSPEATPRNNDSFCFFSVPLSLIFGGEHKNRLTILLIHSIAYFHPHYHTTTTTTTNDNNKASKAMTQIYERNKAITSNIFTHVSTELNSLIILLPL